MQDFPFTIREVAGILNLHIRHKNAVSLDADCPFCGDRKGKLNLNIQKNVFKCNRCGESGGMLALYGKVYGIDNQTACQEIKDALGRDDKAPSYKVVYKKVEEKELEIEHSPLAPITVRNKTYTMMLDMLILAESHKKDLLRRGFTEEVIDRNGYKSTPVFGFKRITKKLIEAGCVVKGVPGFYVDEDGEWNLHFNSKSSGYMVPVRNIDGLIEGMQIRLDRPYDGMKYIWLSSVNYHMGVSSGSPVHLVGEPGAKVVFITEGPLKGDVASFLSGRTFGCVPGVNQYANLENFLKQMKEMGTEFVYEAYDMDKLLKPVCKGDYNEKCKYCEHYKKDWRYTEIPCEKKERKRKNIQNGCKKLAHICRSLNIEGTSLTWDLSEDGNWGEHIKGVDDYLVSLEQKKDK